MDKKWDSITREELLDLYVKESCVDSEVARRFGVTKGQVAYKRKKYDISQSTIAFKRFMSNRNSEGYRYINEDFKRSLMEKDIAEVSKAIAHYVFRNGPVEDMHADGQLSDSDMKILNKYMNDRIATFLYLLKEQDWLRLALFLDKYKYYGSEWDKPELKIEELDKVNELILNLT